VEAEGLVANPGVQLSLSPRKPVEGVSVTTLCLNLHSGQRAGNWQDVITWAPVTFKKVVFPEGIVWTEVKVYDNDEVVAELNVDVVA
jgi:hypothetical protein